MSRVRKMNNWKGRLEVKNVLPINVEELIITSSMAIKKDIKPLIWLSCKANIPRSLTIGLLIIFWGIIMNTSVFASGRMIRLEYKHSRRIQNNEITIELGSKNNNNKIFYAKLFYKDMSQGDDFPIIERSINIDKDYFDIVYEKLLDLNFKEIINSSENIIGTDGTTISITIGNYNNNIKITSWSPDFESTERKTEEIYIILRELFALFSMEEWL